VGSFGIFSIGSKNKLLVDAADFATLGSFQQLFLVIDFRSKKLNTKTRRKTQTPRHEEDAFPRAARENASFLCVFVSWWLD
jgi:hypothetical protein